jgi:hypothetical protein
MPPAIITAIGAIVSAAAATAGTVYSLENQPGKPKLPTGPAPLTTSQNASQAAAVGQQLPSLQSMTGGSVSPEYAAQFGATQSGVANDPQATGNIQDAVNKFFGLTAPGNTGLTPTTGGGGGGGILDLLSKPSQSTPGATGVPGAGGGGGGGGSDFISSLLNSDSFRGLAG